MKKQNWINWRMSKTFTFMVVWLLVCSCGGDGGDSSSNSVGTGSTLHGNIKSVAVPSIQIAEVGGLTISIGDLVATTDEEGNFMIENIPTGDQTVQFEGKGISAFYDLIDIEEKQSFVLRDVEIDGDQVLTEHTGTWTGTAGSTDPGGSDGQIAFTMEIEANGNEIKGTGMLVGSPDNSIWSVEGTETGIKIKGRFELESSASECATGATFEGIFDGNTIDGSFTEMDPPDGCGDPESGTFTLEKE